MPDETVTALQEIAALLRRRVEQQDEAAAHSRDMAHRSEERLAKMDPMKIELPDFSSTNKDMARMMESVRSAGEQRREEERQERDQRYEEERQFRQRLLHELERHNELLETLVARLTHG